MCYDNFFWLEKINFYVLKKLLKEMNHLFQKTFNCRLSSFVIHRKTGKSKSIYTHKHINKQ